MISGIEWVSELIEIAGGDDILPELLAAKGPQTDNLALKQSSRRTPILSLPLSAANLSIWRLFGRVRASIKFRPSKMACSSR